MRWLWRIASICQNACYANKGNPPFMHVIVIPNGEKMSRRMQEEGYALRTGC